MATPSPSASTSARPESRRWPWRPTGRSSRAPRATTASRSPTPGASEAAPDDWSAATDAAPAALDAPQIVGIGQSGADARARRARRTRSACCARRSSGTTSARRPSVPRSSRRSRARAPDRADRQPRADRLHGAQAAVDAHARARALRAHPPRAAAQGLRAPAALRRARDRRRRRLRHAALRRGRAAVLERNPRRARDPRRLDAAFARIARVSGRTAAGVPVAAGAGDCAAAAGAQRGAPCLRSGHPGVSCFAAGLPARSRGPGARFHPEHLARDGRDALGRGLAAVGARHVRTGCRSTSFMREAEAVPAGAGGISSCRTSRASARRTPTRTRAARSSG